ncbi:hypothetical protein G6O67_006896 [Ophiocordyceps sinensis]|uniref:Iron-sulfur cluster assembly factor IBA57 homolog, mitochondrial n=1 Tax=Ophiocordyceps sinensis TaxID=72228 RepID=A0A8H4LX82_9HYPO|nr:hypothetical protein G6O67_006896 [Ophiocordyceps sinensis]
MRRPVEKPALLRHLFVCPGCLQPRRRFATSSPPPPPPPTSGFAPLPSRRLLSVSGPDAAKFLQGIVTANVLGPDGLPRAHAFYTGFLNATGRVVYDAFIYPSPAAHEHGFLVEADAAHVASLAKYIKRYKLRAKVDLRDVSDDQVTVWQAWDDAGALEPAASDSQVVVKDPRAPGLGYRILRLDAKPPELHLQPSTEDAYTVRRYLHGVPEGHDDIIREQALPLEANMDTMNGIDFRKGCYVGQELTIRTKHRGVVRKRILPCMIYANDEPAPQTLAYSLAHHSSTSAPTADAIPSETSIGRVGKRGRSAGKWLKGVGNIGLGLCRLEIMTDVVLPGEQAAASYKPGDEFVLGWGEAQDARSVKVKAFVPDWLRAGLSEAHS